MSTDLSGHAENAPISPEQPPEQPLSDPGESQTAPARAQQPEPRQAADVNQNNPGTDEGTGSPIEPMESTATGGPASSASITGPSPQTPANAPRQPAVGSMEGTGGGFGQSFIADASAYARRWESIQVGFVDDPRAAVQEADTLVSDVMGEMVATFQQQRQQLEGRWSGGEEASTDELRVAFQRYRDVCNRLLQV
jgi:hypothetical protein